MIDNVPLVGSLSTGFGENSIAAMAPTARTPNLAETSKDFVGMLYAYMFSQMRENSSNEEDGLFSGPHVNMLMGFMDQEIGKELASSQGAGLAQEMLKQLTGGQEAITNAIPENAASITGKFDARTVGFEANPLVNAPRTLGRLDTRTEGFEIENPASIDNSSQIMEEIYKLNRRE